MVVEGDDDGIVSLGCANKVDNRCSDGDDDDGGGGGIVKEANDEVMGILRGRTVAKGDFNLMGEL